MTFDTLAVANELKDAGFPPEQAEASACAWSPVASGELVTKADLLAFKSELEQKITGVKADADLNKSIMSLKSDKTLLKWMVGFVMGLVLLVLEKLFSLHS